MARVIRIFDGQAGQPVRDDAFFPVIEWVRAQGALNDPFLVPFRFTPTQEAARDIRRRLYLSARYYCSCGERHCTRKYNNIDGCPNGGQRISCKADVVKDGSRRFRTEFRFFDKRESVRAVVAKYGPDPSKWPYQARAKKYKGA